MGWANEMKSHEMGYGQIRMCLEGSPVNIGAPIYYNVLAPAKTY